MLYFLQTAYNASNQYKIAGEMTRTLSNVSKHLNDLPSNLSLNAAFLVFPPFLSKPQSALVSPSKHKEKIWTECGEH